MRLQQQLELHETYVYTALTGAFELEAAQSLAREMLETGAAHKRRLFLVDVRQVAGRLTASERYAYAAHVADAISAHVAAGRLKGPRLAYVGHPPLMDRLHFGVTVAVNRGLDVTATNDLAKALHWLEGPPRPK